jgi:hypothetical protein
MAIQCLIDDQEKHNTIAAVVECPVQYVVVREQIWKTRITLQLQQPNIILSPGLNSQVYQCKQGQHVLLVL